MVDLSGRAKKSCPESSTGHRREPEHSADWRGNAFPGVGGRAQGTPPSALSILGLKLTSGGDGLGIDAVAAVTRPAARRVVALIAQMVGHHADPADGGRPAT